MLIFPLYKAGTFCWKKPPLGMAASHSPQRLRVRGRQSTASPRVPPWLSWSWGAAELAGSPARGKRTLPF